MQHRFLLKNLLKSFDLQSYIETNFNYKTTNTGEYRICCPACGNGHYKMYVNMDKRVFHCFTCSLSSHNNDFIDLVAKTEGVSRPKIMKRFVTAYKPTTPDDITFDIDEEIHYKDTGIAKIEMPKDLPKTAFGGPGWQYLLSRGMTPEEIKSCNTHFTTQNYPVKNSKDKISGNLQNRVVFPVFGPPGLVSWQGRLIVEGQVKYLSAPESDLSKTLWPFVPPFEKTAIIVEGILDAVAVRRLPKASSYATFGKKLSSHQIEILQAWGVENLIVFFDKKDALPQIQRVVEDTKNKFKSVFVPDYSKWPNGIDAGDTLKSDITPIELALTNKIDVFSNEYMKMIIGGRL